MTVVIGLTGSIGMGKSTTAQMFAAEGVPVWDADAAVHRIYGIGGAAVAPLGQKYPDAVQDGVIDRSILKDLIAADPDALKVIETIVHPLVAADRQVFLDTHQNAEFVVLDIPLLFETGADAWIDVTVVVSAPADLQKARVLARPGMTQAQFDLILARQMPDTEKRARADHVINTETIDGACAAVRQLLKDLGEKQKNA